MKKTVTFGEILLRLSPPSSERFFQSPELVPSFGGGEANVALSLAAFGLESHYVTRLPSHAIGEAALRVLRAQGVRTDYVVRGGERLGIYFAETGAGQREPLVLYDRAFSALTELEPQSVPWARIFQGAHWFHVTGITPALGPKPQANTRAALEAAKRAGVTVSLNLNYRDKLWSPEEAQRVMRPLLEFVDLLIASEDDMAQALGVPMPTTDFLGGTTDLDRYRWVAEHVAREFRIQMVAMTSREQLGGDLTWSGLLYEHASTRLFQAPRYRLTPVETIGAGDGFAAGLIYAVVTGRSAERALAFATAAGALKHTIPGDYNRVSVLEVDRMIG
jgi:2-dehydro-3-deoxygluconokinase